MANSCEDSHESSVRFSRAGSGRSGRDTSFVIPFFLFSMVCRATSWAGLRV